MNTPLPPLCVVRTTPETPSAIRSRVVAALARRGFALFAECSSPEGGHVLIAFNPLVEANDEPGSHYAHAAIDSAVYHLGATLGDAAGCIQVATGAAQSAQMAAETLTSQDMADLRNAIATAQASMATVEPVREILSRHRYRAKVELVEWQGILAVKKTFLPTAAQAMQNEIAFHDDIAPHSPVPARILHRTGNALYFEYISTRKMSHRLLGRSLPQLLPLPQLVELANFARLVCARGWDPLDLTPRDNILIEAQTGALRGIDFEWAINHQKPVALEHSAFLFGLDDDDPAAQNFDAGMRQDPYPGKWRPFTGVSRDSFLYAASSQLRIERLARHPLWLVGRALGAHKRRQEHHRQRAKLLDELALHPSEARPENLR